MNYKELQQIAKEVGAVIDVLILGRHDNTVFTTGELERFAAIIEQRVAEACAKWIDGYAGIHQKEMLSDTAKSFADALRRGGWRKFVKEV